MHPARRFWVCAVLVVMGAGRANALENVTVGELEEEMRLSELVIRGTVLQIHSERFITHAYVQDVTMRIKKLYKGAFPDSQIRLFLNLPTVVHGPPGWPPSNKGPRPAVAANVGDELIVPLKELKSIRGEPDCCYTAPSFYPVRQGEVVGSPYALSEELAKYRPLEDFERLVEKIVAAPARQFDEYTPGRVLFFDDFDDESYAGWTFLVGARGGDAEIENFQGEKWVGPGLRWKNRYPQDKKGTWGELTRNQRTGNYEGVKDGARLEIGVYNGRLRLRSTRLWHHVTVVAGDPNWQDYQVECDAYNFDDKEGLPASQPSYLEFGLYGRVRVPNLPETAGEHSLIAVEFGPYSNEMTLVGMWGTHWHNFYQIRAKWPDAEPARGGRIWQAGREGSFWRKQTKFLDYTAYKIPQKKLIKLKARFTGNRVEGYIDGVKYLDGYLSPLPEIMRKGRIALWVFETWAEFDNVKVTELVPLKKKDCE